MRCVGQSVAMVTQVYSHLYVRAGVCECCEAGICVAAKLQLQVHVTLICGKQ